SVSNGHTVVCTFTNALKGTIELKKHWVGTAGSTTLKIGTAAGGSQTASTAVSGADSSTGAKTVTAGTYYLSEHTTNLANYTQSLDCIDVPTFPARRTTDLIVSNGNTVVCTFTNALKGTIELKKHWVGTAGSTTLKIGTAAGGSQTASTAISGAD